MMLGPVCVAYDGHVHWTFVIHVRAYPLAIFALHVLIFTYIFFSLIKFRTSVLDHLFGAFLFCFINAAFFSAVFTELM